MNKAMLIGNVGRDPEVRNTQSGDKVVSFSVATSEKWKDKSGEKKERVEWHRVVIFNERLGDVAATYLKKGSKVYVEGQIQSRKYQDKKTGKDVTITEIVLTKFRGELQLLDSRPREEKEPAPTTGGGRDFDDEIPFNCPRD